MVLLAIRMEGVRFARPRLATQCVAAFALASLGACASEQIVPLATPYAWSGDTLMARPHLLRDFSDTARQRDVILRAFQIRATSGYIFVSDVGSDRVAVLDSLANVVRWIGSRGRGPGEFRGAGHLSLRDDRLFVAEAFNGRVSEFLFDGSFVATYPSPFAAGALAASPTQVFIAAQSTRTFAAALVRNGDPSDALRRARTAQREHRWSALPGHDLLAADSTGVWVFDQGTGDVCHYASAEAVPACRALPPSLHARLHQYRTDRVETFEAGSGLHVNAAPLAKDMVRAGTWLVLLLPLPELPIALIDVNDASVTPAMIVSDTLPTWTRSATSIAFDGRRFLVVGEDGIGRVDLSRKPTPH